MAEKEEEMTAMSMSLCYEWPRVTIAIPTVDRLQYLRGALASALGQAYPNIEVIVSNNASTDGTADYLASCTDSRLRVLNQSRRLDMTSNWNECVRAATGEFFLLLSDDDLLESAAIQEMVAAYRTSDERQKNAGIVYCGGHIIDAAGVVRRTFTHSPSYESARDLVIGFFNGERDLWLCAILFRTVDIVPGFSLEYAWAPDSATWISAVFKRNGAVFVPLELARYRVHENATASLPINVWKAELDQLGQVALRCSQRRDASDPDPMFSKTLETAIRRLIIRSLPIRINATLADKKLKAISQYYAFLPTMTNRYGMRFLVAGLASLFLPKKIKTGLKSVMLRQQIRSGR